MVCHHYIRTGVGLRKTYTTNYTTSKFYSFVTNVTFYDFREQDTVQAVQIDIAKFNIWLTNTQRAAAFKSLVTLGTFKLDDNSTG